jgi:transketolase
LNLGAKISQPVAPFSAWRKIKDGKKAVVVGTGPVVGNIINLDTNNDYEVWVLSVFPVQQLPEELVVSVNATRKLITIEEHNGECGLRETISYHIMNRLSNPIQLKSFSAHGYPSGKYGDQKWHQEENALGGAPLAEQLAAFI